MEHDFRQRAIARKARIENCRSVPHHPPAAAVGSDQRVKVLASRSVYLAFEGLRWNRLELLKQDRIVDHAAPGRSNVNAIQKLVHDCQHFVDAALLDQLGRDLIAQ